MSVRRAAVLFVAVAAPVAWLAGAGATASAAANRTLTVADSAEAWYAASPIDICTTPLGCPPPQAPTSPYPADTLHVGAAGGQESARTYLVPDLASLPFDATLVGGEMTLPVATATADGSVSPDTAKIRACLTTAAVPDGTAGSTSAPPAVNCAISATPSYDSTHATFTLDLQPFVDAWAAGAPRLGIALVPDAKAAQPTDAWHVTFNGRKRAGGAHVSSSIVVAVNPVSAAGVVAPAPPAATVVPAVPAPSLPAPVAVPPAAAAPIVAGGAAPRTVAVQPVALSREFQYPLAFLLPLVLLVATVFFVRLFTRDATPRRVRA